MSEQPITLMPPVSRETLEKWARSMEGERNWMAHAVHSALHYESEAVRLREAAEPVAFWHEDRVVTTEECPDFETALRLLRRALDTTGAGGNVSGDNDLIGNTDARAWAQRFVERAAENPEIPKDEGAMLAWFAAAIEAGRDAGLTARVAGLEEQMRRLAAALGGSPRD